MVLLKNDGVLPFNTKKIALYGSGAAHTIKGGTGSGEVNERHSVTILEGLENRGFEITSKAWLEEYDEEYALARQNHEQERNRRLNIFKPSSIMEMLFDGFRPPCGRVITRQEAEESGTDACIYILSRQAGECGDRRAEKGDYFLTDDEERAISACAKNYKNFVLAINCGSPIDMSFMERIPEIGAVVYLCQLGTEGGNAFADLISGAVSPSGKLTDTWARSYNQIPFSQEYSYLNGNLDNEFYKEGIYVGYRYFDSFSVEPAFPFGFGLSYTDFDIHPTGVSIDGSAVTVKAAVSNIGKRYAGKEVVQLYVSAPAGALDKEYQSLAAFGKSKVLAPGEAETLELRFDMKALASFREADNCFILEPGDYVLRLGYSSRNTHPIGAVRVSEEIVVSEHQAICPQRIPMQELKSPARTEELIPDELPRLELLPSAIKTVKHSYQQPEICSDPRVKEFMKDLTTEDMAEIVVGKGMFTGEAKFDLPGSVGNTTSKFWDRGLVNIALCDGPAGLRIQRRSALGRNDKIKPVDMALSVFNNVPGFVKKLIVSDPEKSTLLYQFATAFPVENALGQTWNTELIYNVGKAVYREMKEYGCTYWLAPAVNIHRNPLCGRNFEYFSEDPMLTGAMASALIRGVQQELGFYVTVKHFACNNQEENRNHVSSNLSQRALREIYLRGFEACVRKGGAKGVMTSYNKVNGVYPANSHDLCTKVLRCEWGFDGVVMTDWLSTKRGEGNNALAMLAGNDLIMPGMGYCKKEILNALKAGQLNITDLERCCANVLRAILDSATQREYMG